MCFEYKVDRFSTTAVFIKTMTQHIPLRMHGSFKSMAEISSCVSAYQKEKSEIKKEWWQKTNRKDFESKKV